MHGLMMQQSLLISSLLKHAERHHGEQQVVSRRIEGDIHRYTFRDLASRSRRMANALHALGVTPGTVVATLAWNGYRHMELYYAVSGSGGILHTLNPRLHPDQLVWIAEHAQDSVLFFDLTFLPLIEQIAARLPAVRAFVLMSDRAHMPTQTGIPNLLCYEELIEAHDDRFEWPEFDENTASSLCYTSGTTGNPKGVLYSHRSTMLHTFAVALPDSLGLGAQEVVLPVVPMFHANAWGLPYAACMVGAKLVLPGSQLDGKSLYELLEAERVTLSSGVPTVWHGLLTHVEQNGLRFSSMRRTNIGGAACPPAMLRAFTQRHGVAVIHGWGMTETSPVGSAAILKGHQLELSEDDRFAIQARQGRCVFGIDWKIVDDDANELPWDGRTAGHLMVRGLWVLERYFKAPPGQETLRGGWFPTGDIATIDGNGFMQITDRSKDVIKSGGEWIGSIELENIAMAHHAVAMAACIGVPHPKWDARPLLVIEKKPGTTPTREELIGFFEGKVAKWWVPDDVVFVDTIPLGTTGKMLKTELRERFASYRLPTA
jgi:acyl-CoA synthetase (AMP-forming)/AMP-acid ligase II